MISISDDVAVTNQTHTRWVQLVQDKIIEKVLSSLTFNGVGVTQSLMCMVEFVFLPKDIPLWYIQIFHGLETSQQTTR